MTDTTDDLDLLRSNDPAAGADADPSSVAGRAIHQRIVTSVDQDPAPPPRGSHRRRVVVVTVATLSVATGAAAVAQIGPFANEWEACHGAPGAAGRDLPYPECADFVTDRVLAEVEADGSAFEREVLADRRVTSDEYHEAAHRTVACIDDALDRAGVPGASASAEFEAGSDLSGFTIAYPDGFDPSTLPWHRDDATATSAAEGGTPQPATPLTDEMIRRDPMSRCMAEHFDRIHSVWEAQGIASQ